MVTGKARRCNSGKSTWTLSHWAWQSAKRNHRESYNKEVGSLGGCNAAGQPALMLWWPQCEVIKAIANYAVLHGRSDLWPIHRQTLDFVKKTYLDPEYGGWFEGYIPGETRQQISEKTAETRPLTVTVGALTVTGEIDFSAQWPYHSKI
jgi:mannose/cellobiose epimerase-like protein (N-acyl-D-glucosamine 2-epimerase family)